MGAAGMISEIFFPYRHVPLGVGRVRASFTVSLHRHDCISVSTLVFILNPLLARL